MPQRGDVVLYSQNGKVYNAIVLMAHALNESHLGSKLEPQLHLAVLFDDPPGAFAPPPAPKGTLRPGYMPEMTAVYDVVHFSHEFSAEYMRSHGLRNLPKGSPHQAVAEAEIRNRRGAGTWREAIVVLAEDQPSPQPSSQPEPQE